MGVSTDGMLFYGIHFEEDFTFDDEDDFYGDEDAKRLAIEPGYHCSADYPMYYLAIKESELRAWRGSPKEVNSLEVGDNWDKRIQDFCALKGIEPQSECRWWLVSLWA